MTTPQIDVFIPVYNDRKFLPIAVRSALKQQGVQTRVVVCDNCSTDGTWEWLQEQTQLDARIVIHQNETNIGAINNLNRFREHVKAPFYMLLCSDDMLMAPSALATAYRVMQDDADCVSVYCNLNYIDANNTVVAKRDFKRTGQFDSEMTLKQSIVGYRNMFGIPLLNLF